MVNGYIATVYLVAEEADRKALGGRGSSGELYSLKCAGVERDKQAY